MIAVYMSSHSVNRLCIGDNHFHWLENYPHFFAFCFLQPHINSMFMNIVITFSYFTAFTICYTKKRCCEISLVDTFQIGADKYTKLCHLIVEQESNVDVMMYQKTRQVVFDTAMYALWMVAKGSYQWLKCRQINSGTGKIKIETWVVATPSSGTHP